MLRAGAFIVGHMRARAAGQNAPASSAEPDFIVKLDARVQLAGLRATLHSAPLPRGSGACGATARKPLARGAGVKPSAPRHLPLGAAPLPPRAAPFPQLPELELLPQAAVWDVLMLWDMGNTFAPLLQLPSFSIDRASAAFWDCSALRSASDEPTVTSQHDGNIAAAATLFSDFCCGLFRVISGECTATLTAGASLTAVLPEDVTAPALEATISRIAWPARVASYLGRTDTDEDADEAPVVLFSEAATAALSVAVEADNDCWAVLDPSQRLALATSLADAASASDTFREYFNTAHEAAQAAQRLGRVPANPVRLPVGGEPKTHATVDEGADAQLDDSPAARTWEDAAADRSLLRRGLPVGVDELGNRYHELGAAAGANALFVARPPELCADSGVSAGGTLLDFGLPPRWSVVKSGSRAASELAAWLLPRRCAGEHAPKAFCERLAAASHHDSAGDTALCFPPPAPVADGYSAIAEAALPGGLLGVRRVVAALARRVHFWQLPAEELRAFAADLRKFSEAESESTAPHDGYGVDIVAAQAVRVCTMLMESGTLADASWDSGARCVWQDLLAEAVTAPQLGVAFAHLHAALEAADSAAAHGTAPVVMNRQSFLLAAAQHDPTLWVPAVGDDVAVLRAGLLRTWRCLSKSWAVEPPTGLAPVTSARVIAASYRRAASGSSYGKRAVAWLLLDGGDGGPFAAPVVLAEGAPECVLPHRLVADAQSNPWKRGNAIQILVVDDDGSTRHVRGVVVKVRENDCDPWESVRIRCRPDTAGELHRSAWVSPWELHHDLNADSQLDAGADVLLELPTSDEDEELEESSTSSSDDEDTTTAGAVTVDRKLHGRRLRPSGGKAKLRRGPASARPVPAPLAASAASVAAATRQLLADIQRGDPEAPPVAGDEAAARLVGMKEFGRRYRAYWQSRGGTPRVPIFARTELELWPAFQAVASRGGYDAVGASKQWIAVARALPGRDLSTATSASFSMRVAYERSVFAFERSTVAILLGQPDPFPAKPGVAAAVAAVCGHDERNRRKSGGTAAAARKVAVPARHTKRARSDGEDDSSDDDAAAAVAAAPVRRPPPRAAATTRGVAAKPAVEEVDWDFGGVAAGRRVRKRVCYKDSDSQEDVPESTGKRAAKATGRRRAAHSSDDDDEEEEGDDDDDDDDEGTSDDDSSSDADSDADGDDGVEHEAAEDTAKDSSSSETILRHRSARPHKARRRRVMVADDDDDN